VLPKRNCGFRLPVNSQVMFGMMICLLTELVNHMVHTWLDSNLLGLRIDR